MIKNYLKIAVRNLLRFKTYTVINLAGMVMGLSIGVLILIFVMDELSFDKFHVKGDNIYRVVTQMEEQSMDRNGWAVGHKLRTEFPEVEAVVYTRNAYALQVYHDGKKYDENIHFASEEFFRFFSFEMIQGSPENALDAPYSAVITESVRNRYFDAENVVGKTLTIGDSIDFIVTGVVADVPSQSHIQFDILLSFATYEKLTPNFTYSGGWGNINVRNYVLLKEGANFAALSAKARNIYMDNVGEWLQKMGMILYVKLEPLKDVYLISEAPNGFGPKGAISQVYLVAAIAIFVILLACTNFVNLTTARAVYRAKEVGLRKVVGSSRSLVFWQFISESFILTVIAFLLAMLIADMALPFFNSLMSKSYDFSDFFNITNLLCMLGLVLAVSVLSGYYPAWVMSGYRPAQVLKGKLQTGRKGVRLRRMLVVFQFVVSAGLVLGTLIVLRQLDYMQDQDLGFNKEQVLIVDATQVSSAGIYETFKHAVRSNAFVEQVTYTNALPGRPGWSGQVAFPEGFEEGENVVTEYMSVDEDYIATLGLELVAGRNFSKDSKADFDEGVIINETAVKEMRWETPDKAIGKRITSPSGYPEGIVIGVVKDYHGLGLQTKISPKVMDYNPDASRYFAIHFNTGSTSDVVSDIKNSWSNHFPDSNFEYFFLDQEFDKQYRYEQRLMKVLIIFAVLTIVIAGIGLLGLISFMIISKTKEIGVRKVLGAGVWNIAGMLSKEFLVLVITANFIAIPLIWYTGNYWLEGFAYRMTLQPDIFIITFSITLGMTFITVSYKTIKAAMLNPVETLRNE
ncbi:ABC transporter permease [Fulvivirga kasyanovii]|uniref:ABC transporter permease n=1 Tax=Fulvivirga kasyanovii TaxID=396812 RepID=A0ABW9RRG3_9BACT|nr:ABC transporter permease [Fulvivirga kasyanovii]MTI26784.1 ABC transporter permease [Fulvivirga kasyanovii]